jgi:hypothetical protein
MTSKLVRLLTSIGNAFQTSTLFHVILTSLLSLLLLGGLASFVFYADHVAHHTYLSENALLPGAAQALYGQGDVSWMLETVDKLIDVRKKKEVSGEGGEMEVMMRLLREVGMEPSLFPHPLFSSSSLRDAHIRNETLTSGGEGGNRDGLHPMVMGVLRSYRGDGAEAVVLDAPYEYITSSHLYQNTPLPHHADASFSDLLYSVSSCSSSVSSP